MHQAVASTSLLSRRPSAGYVLASELLLLLGALLALGTSLGGGGLALLVTLGSFWLLWHCLGLNCSGI